MNSQKKETSMSSGSGDPRSDLPVWLTGMAIGLALLLIAALSYQLVIKTTSFSD